MLLQEDLIQVLPMVAEANAMAEELNKGVKFEITLVSPQARGLQNGRTEVSIQLCIYQNFSAEKPPWRNFFLEGELQDKKLSRHQELDRAT